MSSTGIQKLHTESSHNVSSAAEERCGWEGSGKVFQSWLESCFLKVKKAFRNLGIAHGCTVCVLRNSIRGWKYP